MPAPALFPNLSVFTAFARFAPPQPVHTFFRSTAYRLRPPRPLPHPCLVTRAQTGAMARGLAGPHQRATVLREHRLGATPTIVLGGFVPDATEQVFLLRGFLLRQGSVYYLNYPRGGFSPALIYAQLDDLVEELNAIHGQRPVIFAVSFGAGLVLDWLRRARESGRAPDLAGLVLVSPVACAADIVTPGEAKPSTLLGRALKPYLDGGARTDPAGIEKSRTIFAKMFEAGAQNRAALRALMTAGELRRVRDAVFAAIKDIDATGACERVRALREMPPMSAWDAAAALPLSPAPVLVLYAEKESAVLAGGSPTRTAFESALAAFFPGGELRVVAGRRGSAPVQHASLIFHYFEFLPFVAGFYRRLKSGKIKQAA